MFHGSLRPQFKPDPAGLTYEKEREEWVRRLTGTPPEDVDKEREEWEAKPPQAPSLARLMDLISPEDSALVALIVFLLCDNTNNDVVLLGILLYILLSK